MVSLRSAACGIAVALAFLAALPAAGQSATVVPGAARPKVCLVLSGGGARGAAHIGVLKVLEEYRVPVDCITGTSMGSLVGAAYASGMTVPEMEAFTSRITFDLLFKEAPPREELTVRRKQEDLRFNLFSPDIGVSDRGEVGFAKGVVSGVRLETVLRELSRVKGYIDFDKLPIRFRAIATDLVTGKPKVFDKGDLALAMRASMSVPGIIAPAEFDGMMLVDGGLVNNLPVDVARALGADIVIAVNLGTPLAKAEAITNVLGITGQMIAILTEQNVQATLATLKPTDILILPELGTYSAGDFDNMRTTFPIGEAAARKVADRLAGLSLPAEQYAQFQSRRTQTTLASALTIDEVRFESTRSRVNPEFLGTLIETQAGEPLDQAKLDRDLLRLYGTEDFEHVSYRLIESPTRRILNIQGVEKSWGPNYLRFGLGLTTDFSGDAFFNLQGRYRRTWLNSYGGEWYTDLSIGRNTALYSEFYQPVDAKQRFFVAPYLDVERRYVDVFVGNDPLSEYALPAAVVGVDIGGQLSRYGELRVGLFGGITRPDLNSGPQLLADEKSATLAGVRLRAYLDQLDSANFPKRGYAAQLDLISGLQALGSDTNYDRWDFNAIAAVTVGRHTVQVGAKGTGPITQDNAGLSYVAQPWGGFLQQSGFRTGQLLNERFVYGRVQYSYRALTVPLFEGLYVGAAGEIGNYGAPLVAGNPTGTLYSGTAYVALDSPIGPMYLGYGVGSGGNNAAYFFLGRP